MAQEPDLSFDLREEALLAVMQREELDEALTRKMREEVAAKAGEARQLPVVLDLSQVVMLPSLSLGALVELLKELRGHKQRLMLVGIQPQVRESLALTRLDRLFEIYDNADDALTRLQADA